MSFKFTADNVYEENCWLSKTGGLAHQDSILGRLDKDFEDQFEAQKAQQATDPLRSKTPDRRSDSFIRVNDIVEEEKESEERTGDNSDCISTE